MAESSPERGPAPIDRRALIRDTVALTSLLGAGACASLALLVSSDVAIAVVVGTGLGILNFVLLARGVAGAIDRTVAGVERARDERGPTTTRDGLEPEDVLGRPLGAGGGLRIALSVLLIAALIWYLPIDPAGVASGIVLSLLGASWTSYRHNRDRARPD